MKEAFSQGVSEIPSKVQPIRPRIGKPKQTLNSLKVPDRKMSLNSNPLSKAEIPRKASIGSKNTIPLTKYPQKKLPSNR